MKYRVYIGLPGTAFGLDDVRARRGRVVQRTHGAPLPLVSLPLPPASRQPPRPLIWLRRPRSWRARTRRPRLRRRTLREPTPTQPQPLVRRGVRRRAGLWLPRALAGHHWLARLLRTAAPRRVAQTGGRRGEGVGGEARRGAVRFSGHPAQRAWPRVSGARVRGGGCGAGRRGHGLHHLHSPPPAHRQRRCRWLRLTRQRARQRQAGAVRGARHCA